MKSDPDLVQAEVLATELRSEAWQSALGICAILVVTIYLQITFADRVAAALMLPWLAMMYGGAVVWLVSLVSMTLRRPQAAEVKALWIPLARALMSLFNLGVAASVWIFMPVADPPAQTVVVLLLVWFVTTQLLGSTEATQVALPAILGVIGSMIVYLLVTRPANALPLMGFLTAFGVTSMALRGFIRGSVIRSVEARVLSERAALALEEALAVTAAERDAKTRFIQSATHDLQQPIQAASLYVEDARKAESPEDRIRAIDGARRAFASSRELLEHMLEYLRLDAGAVQLQPRPLALAPIIAAVAEAHRPAALAAGMTIRTPRTGLAVLADQTALTRALGNLVGNGVKHARGERVLIGARRRPDGQVDLWVIDDGDGVAPADADRLFEDFVQGAAAHGRGGFGLGLSSVRRIAALMGGSAGLDRRWTGGGAFYIRLPAAATGRARAVARTPRDRSGACAPA